MEEMQPAEETEDDMTIKTNKTVQRTLILLCSTALVATAWDRPFDLNPEGGSGWGLAV